MQLCSSSSSSNSSITSRITTISSNSISNTTNSSTRKGKFYLMTHSTHFIYGYMASKIAVVVVLVVTHLYFKGPKTDKTASILT